jgi:hypothetical protein
MKDILLTLAQFAMKMDKEAQLKNVSSFIVVMHFNIGTSQFLSYNYI